MNTKRFMRGFTIVELLIVIVVIGILAALVISTYSGVQARAKDAKRVSDFQAIQKALELYKIDNNQYPPCNNSSANTVACDVSGLSNALTPKYIPTLPADPINSGFDVYHYVRGYKKAGTNSHTNTDSVQDYTMGTYLEAQGCPCSGAWGSQVNYMVGTQ